ncbi:hypothetical protein EWU53_08745 [Enterococcus faecium]|nr:hypothetical protein EWU28_08660 [Enterococcus faecium]TAQ28725.1 hypothetical protein EWU53_08745 [Enterococcus faecium]
MVHSDSDLILHNSSVLIDKEPINGVLLPTPRSQVTISIKHKKLFFKIVSCDSELNGRLTTSW